MNKYLWIEREEYKLFVDNFDDFLILKKKIFSFFYFDTHNKNILILTLTIVCYHK